MARLIVALTMLMFLFSWQAMADNGPAQGDNSCVGNCPKYDNGGHGKPVAKANQKQQQQQQQQQKQGQFQKATGGSATASNSGNNQTSSNSSSVSFNDTRQAPALGYSSYGPCNGAGGGVTTPVGGILITTEDEQCTLRQNIEVVKQFDSSLAAEMLNDLKGVQAARARIAEKNKPKTVSVVQSGTTQVAEQPSGRPEWCSYIDLTTNSKAHLCQ